MSVSAKGTKPAKAYLNTGNTDIPQAGSTTPKRSGAKNPRFLPLDV